MKHRTLCDCPGQPPVKVVQLLLRCRINHLRHRYNPLSPKTSPTSPPPPSLHPSTLCFQQQSTNTQSKLASAAKKMHWIPWLKPERNLGLWNLPNSLALAQFPCLALSSALLGNDIILRVEARVAAALAPPNLGFFKNPRIQEQGR